VSVCSLGKAEVAKKVKTSLIGILEDVCKMEKNTGITYCERVNEKWKGAKDPNGPLFHATQVSLSLSSPLSDSLSLSLSLSSLPCLDLWDETAENALHFFRLLPCQYPPHSKLNHLHV
jgi:hypothetical protein